MCHQFLILVKLTVALALMLKSPIMTTGRCSGNESCRDVSAAAMFANLSLLRQYTATTCNVEGIVSTVISMLLLLNDLL